VLPGGGTDAGVSQQAKFELGPHSVTLSTSDPCSARRFFVITDNDPVAGLGVEASITCTGSVADPRLDNQVGTNAVGVVPQVVLERAHDTMLRQPRRAR
jgi:hypothetical protein